MQANRAKDRHKPPMMRSRLTLLYIIGIVVTAALTVSCHDGTVYHHYEQTEDDGWDRGDTLHFTTPAVSSSGDYQAFVEIRSSRAYPFMNLDIIVEQTVLPAHYTEIDTLMCYLADDKGQMQGSGISEYQYRKPFKTLRLRQGDSLSIQIRHNMKREILPGITDIGYQLKKQAAQGLQH